MDLLCSARPLSSPGGVPCLAACWSWLIWRSRARLSWCASASWLRPCCFSSALSSDWSSAPACPASWPALGCPAAIEFAARPIASCAPAHSFWQLPRQGRLFWANCSSDRWRSRWRWANCGAVVGLPEACCSICRCWSSVFSTNSRADWICRSRFAFRQVFSQDAHPGAGRLCGRCRPRFRRSVAAGGFSPASVLLWSNS